MASIPADQYAARFNVDYEETRDRVTVLFRIFLVIPILVVLALLEGASVTTQADENTRAVSFAAAGSIGVATALMILFRERYPRWWFDFQREFTRFSMRVMAYLLLLRDEYPSTEDEQAVHVELDYPDARQLNRWLPLVKWLLAIPHYVVLFFLAIGALLAAIAAWFAILITGRMPRGLFDYIVGVGRWGIRVQAYAFLLLTDRYPPFSLR